MLRLEWWLNHGHTRLSGDNGEMWCEVCLADYKQQPLEELEPLVCAARAVSMPISGISRSADRVSITPHDRGGPLPTLPEEYHAATAAIIQRARGMLVDGADPMSVGSYVATYAVLVPLPKEDIGAILAYLIKAADNKGRRELLVEQRKTHFVVPGTLSLQETPGNGTVVANGVTARNEG